MTRNLRRVQLAPGYILHHYPYRDTSRILEVFTREHGRLSLFARGVRGPKAKLAPYVQPFRPLLLSWAGKGDAPTLTGAENASAVVPMPSACLMAGFYLNELLLKLLTRHDPHPTLFDSYHEALEAMKNAKPLERTLRIFEKRLLEELGYGLDLTVDCRTGESIDPQEYYQFRPAQGLYPCVADSPGALSGSSLMSLARESIQTPSELEDSRRLLQAALAHCLEGRELATRAVARSIARRESAQ